MTTRPFVYTSEVAENGLNRFVAYNGCTSGNSPKVNGRLVLQQNSLSFANLREVSRKIGNVSRISQEDVASVGSPPAEVTIPWSALDTNAYAKFQGKLKSNSASLGLTAFTWRQSLGMITEKIDMARTYLIRRQRILDRTPISRREARREYRRQQADPYGVHDPALSNRILEAEFGWKSLFSDLSSAFKVLGDPLPNSFITTRSRAPLVGVVQGVDVGAAIKNCRVGGEASVTFSCSVKLTNHNLWLLNKLGLINPLGIIWDAIPWSFLVGAFVNVNQMMNSLTDEVGIEISNQSLTRTQKCVRTCSYDFHPWAGGGRNSYYYSLRTKSRTLGVTPRPSFETRIPKFDLETAAILTGLLVQQSSRFTRFLAK